MDIRITKLTKNQLDTHIDDFIGIINEEIHEYWTKINFQHPLPGKFSISCIATLHGKTTGFIIASIKANNTAYIHKIAVLKKYRSLSIGSQLIAFFRALAIEQNCTTIQLSVYSSNNKARSFYQKNDFKETGTRIDQNNNELIILNKDLNE